MATFSGALVLTDLNDFIAPSQACIKPAQPEQSGNAVEKEDAPVRTPVFSLTDCLACAGCITSAESILITSQSEQELIAAINNKDNPRTVVVSIAPQSAASIAAKFNLSIDQAYSKLTAFFKSHLRINHVFDVAFARDIALIASAKEFIRRFRAASESNNSTHLPMLSGACPGWICYAEKTHHIVLPLIDTTKSPQQIMGSIVKDYFAQKLGVSDHIYHVTIMPCYDKKLEASRQDFYNDVFRTRDVDCVLTTGEVERLLNQESIDIRSIADSPQNDIFTKCGQSEGTSSGGHLSFVLRYAVRELYGIHLTPSDIQNGTNGVSIIPGRNPDSTDVFFTPPGASEPTLHFAYAYGFRNIQNFIRKIKPSKTQLRSAASRRNLSSQSASGPYHYIEVMACPSGCINGGGQLRPPTADQDTVSGPLPPSIAKPWIAQTEQTYRSSTNPIAPPEQNESLTTFCQEWLDGWPNVDSQKSRNLLFTTYHAVSLDTGNTPSTTTGLVAKW